MQQVTITCYNTTYKNASLQPFSKKTYCTQHIHKYKRTRLAKLSTMVKLLTLNTVVMPHSYNAQIPSQQYATSVGWQNMANNCSFKKQTIF